MTKDTGPLIILSGPSGSGKSTVIGRLLAMGDLPWRLSVSATTRPPRTGEKDGVNYYFWTRPRFEEGIQAGEFLEWALVHGNYYGTLRREVEPYQQQGIGVILDIDVQGAAAIRRQFQDQLSIFLRAPSLETYEQRLRARGEDEASIQRRLATARRELTRAGDYDCQVTNDDLDSAVAELHAILKRQFERGEHVR